MAKQFPGSLRESTGIAAARSGARGRFVTERREAATPRPARGRSTCWA